MWSMCPSVFFFKQKTAYEMEVAARTLRRFGTKPIWLTLQNGLEKARVLARTAMKGGAGITSPGVALGRPGEVRHAGVGDTVIGGFSGVDENDVVRVRDVFEESGIHTTISPNIRRDLWLKVIVNAGINPLAALTGLRNGQLVVVPPLREAMTELCAEAAAVARAEGFELSNREAINLTGRGAAGA